MAIGDYKVVHIVAKHHEHGYIAVNNELPWTCKQDMNLFKKFTTGHPVVMTRSSYLNYGHRLKHRHHIVLTRDKEDYIIANGPSDKPFYKINNMVDLRHVVDEYGKTFKDLYTRDVFKDNVLFVIGGPVAYGMTSEITDASIVVHLMENQDTPELHLRDKELRYYDVPSHLKEFGLLDVPFTEEDDDHRIRMIQLYTRGDMEYAKEKAELFKLGEVNSVSTV